MAGTIKLDGTTFLTKDSSNNFTLDVGSGGSISQGTFNGTVGSNATFPNGIIEDQTIIKYALGTANSYAHANTSYRVATRKSDASADVEDISVNAGYTYIYEYTGFGQSYAGATIQRAINIYLHDDDTNRSRGNSSVNTPISRVTVGRERNESDGAYNTTQAAFHIVGASYYSSDDTRYIYLTTTTNNSSNTVSMTYSSGLPLYLKITKIKGNILISRT